MARETLPYQKVSIGDVYSFEHTFTKDDEHIFGTLTLDTSSGEVVHGMLLASLFSTLIDIYGPGPESIYVSQNIEFRKPVLYGTVMTIRGEVMEKSDSTRMITIKTEIVVEDKLSVSGIARIRL